MPRIQDRNTGDLRNISSNVLDNHSFLSIFIVPSSSGSYYFMLRMLDGKRDPVFIGYDKEMRFCSKCVGKPLKDLMKGMT